VRLVANDMAFWFHIGFLNTKRPSLPRITRCLSSGPPRHEGLPGGTGDHAIGWKRASEAHPKPSGIPSKTLMDGLGWAEEAHPSTTKEWRDNIQGPSKTRLDGDSASRDDARVQSWRPWCALPPRRIHGSPVSGGHRVVWTRARYGGPSSPNLELLTLPRDAAPRLPLLKSNGWIILYMDTWRWDSAAHRAPTQAAPPGWPLWARLRTPADGQRWTIELRHWV